MQFFWTKRTKYTGPVFCLLLKVCSDYAHQSQARLLKYLPGDWPSTAWAYSESETENGPSTFLSNYTRNFLWDLLTHPFSTFKAGLNLTAVEFRAWMGNRSPLFYVECIYYGPIIQSFEGVFGGGQITALNKQSSGRWNEMHTRTCDVTVIRPAYV